MCTAQVLLLNRDVMRRNFGGDVNRRVCRKLFDTSDSANPVDPAVFLKRMQEEIRKKDTERWNFDFMTETPLPGRYQWEPVFSGSSGNKQTTTELNREERTAQAAVEPIVEEIRREAPASQKRKRKGAGVSSQHKITDYMTKKKKLSLEESSSSKTKLRRVNRNTESLATTTRLR